MSLYGYGQPYYFKHYQVENGLSNNTVYAAVQDQKGFMWFGTKDGLNRFDGYTFKTYRNDPNDLRSIGNNLVFSLHIDPDQEFFSGTAKGVYKFDPDEESFQLLPQTEGTKAYSINSDLQGNLWIITAGGLMKINKRGTAVQTFKNIPGRDYSCVFRTEDGTIWAGASDGLLSKYDPATRALRNVKISNTLKSEDTGPISAMAQTSDGKLLVGTTTHGLKLFDPATGFLKSIIKLNRDKTDIYVREIIKNSDQEYWIGTESGVYIYNHNSGAIIQLEKQNTNR